MRILTTFLMLLATVLPGLAATTYPAATNAPNIFFQTNTFLTNTYFGLARTNVIGTGGSAINAVGITNGQVTASKFNGQATEAFTVANPAQAILGVDGSYKFTVTSIDANMLGHALTNAAGTVAGLPLAGGTLSDGVTNNSANGFRGNGGGLTNVTAIAFGGVLDNTNMPNPLVLNQLNVDTLVVTNGGTVNGGLTNNSAQGFVGNGSGLTNVPFSVWTNFTAAPTVFTNLSGIAFDPGFGMNFTWTFTNVPGVGPVGVFLNGANTNCFITTNGGTFYRPIYSGAASTNSPGNNELVTAQWVRNLFTAGAAYYTTTNIEASATNASPAGQLVYQFSSTIPLPSSRSYLTTDYLTNGGYLGSVCTTNTFSALGGQILVSAYFGYTGGSSTPTLTLHPEIYYSYDRTNWLGDYSAANQLITYGSTNLYQWVVDFPQTVSTSASGFYIERRYKVGTVTGVGTRTLTLLIGTNALSGTTDASHITMQSPTATSGNAYLANNQTFSGNNTFSQPIIAANGSALNLATAAGFSTDGAGSAITAGNKGGIAVIPYNCTIQSVILAGNPAGNATVDIYWTNYANLLAGNLPAAATSLVGGGGTKPSLSSAVCSSNGVANWGKTTLTKGDGLIFNVSSPATITNLNCFIWVTR